MASSNSVMESQLLNQKIINIMKRKDIILPLGSNNKLIKAYDKFSDNLIRKIKKASNNGKDEKAIGIKKHLLT